MILLRNVLKCINYLPLYINTSKQINSVTVPDEPGKTAKLSTYE